MKAFAIDELGRPGSLHDLPFGEPTEGQVRVRVVAAGLNPFDNAVVQGYLKRATRDARADRRLDGLGG